MDRTVILMFSGQGCQYYQMGLELYHGVKRFRYWMDALDYHFREMTGESLITALYPIGMPKSAPFDRLLHTHASIYAVEYALAQTLMEYGLTPDYVLGSSVGEFAAAATADIISAEDGMEAVVTQAQIIESLCEEGRMLAVLDHPAIFEKDDALCNNGEVASINFDSHFVVAGGVPGIRKISSLLESRGVAVQMIPVRYGFHSSAIDAAQTQYVQYLSRKTFKSPRVGYLSAAVGGPLESMGKHHFWDAVRGVVRFKQTIENLPQEKSCLWIDASPTGTSAGFVKYLRPGTESSFIFPVMSPYAEESKPLRNFLKFAVGHHFLNIAF